jgi:hypothetical protein
MKPSCPSQSTIPMYPKALDDTQCAQCREDAQFLPNEGRNFQHSKPKDHHVWRDSWLQETLESASWTILSGAQGRYTLTRQICLDDSQVNLMVRRNLRIWICNQSLDFFLGQTVDVCDLPVAQLV